MANNIITVILVGLLVVGVILSWRDITNGSGFVASRLPQYVISWLNDRKPSCIVVKILASLFLGILYYFILVIKLLLRLFIFFSGFFKAFFGD